MNKEATFDDRLSALNALPYIEEIQEFLGELDANANPSVDEIYLSANACWRLEYLQRAFDLYLEAANGGRFAGYYCAARIFRENASLLRPELSEKDIYWGLISSAAEQGHMWARLELAKSKRMDSIAARIRYYVLRFVCSPVIITKALVFDKDQEKVRV